MGNSSFTGLLTFMCYVYSGSHMTNLLIFQFFKLDGKHFAFTFVGDITHDDFNMIAVADDDTRAFLQRIKESGRLDNTLLIMMGDHGPR